MIDLNLFNADSCPGNVVAHTKKPIYITHETLKKKLGSTPQIRSHVLCLQVESFQ